MPDWRSMNTGKIQIEIEFQLQEMELFTFRATEDLYNADFVINNKCEYIKLCNQIYIYVMKYI